MNKVSVEELRQFVADYMANTSVEKMKKDIDSRKHLRLDKVFKAADDARTRVSGYSRRQRAELLKKARALMSLDK